MKFKLFINILIGCLSLALLAACQSNEPTNNTNPEPKTNTEKGTGEVSDHSNSESSNESEKDEDVNEWMADGIEANELTEESIQQILELNGVSTEKQEGIRTQYTYVFIPENKLVFCETERNDVGAIVRFYSISNQGKVIDQTEYSGELLRPVEDSYFIDSKDGSLSFELGSFVETEFESGKIANERYILSLDAQGKFRK